MLARVPLPGIPVLPCSRSGCSGTSRRCSSPVTTRAAAAAAAASSTGLHSQAKSLFIFGLGYSGAAIAKVAQQHGWGVYSTCRDMRRFAPVQSPTHTVMAFDPAADGQLSDSALQALSSCSCVISTIPPLAAKLYDPALRKQLRAIQAATAAPSSQLSWVGYLSSTGVYGDWQGAWVDESSPTRSSTAQGLLRLEAEAAWVAAAQSAGLNITLFRLGGIYGPRRSIIDSLSKDPALLSASKQRRGQQKYISRCHVADIAAAVVATAELQLLQQNGQPQQQMLTGHPSQRDAGGSISAAEGVPVVDVLNVVDDLPAPRQEVKRFAAELLQLPLAATGAAALSSEPTTASLPPPAPASSVDLQSATPATEQQQNLPAADSYAVRHQQLQQQQQQQVQEPIMPEPRRARRSEAVEEKRVSNAKLKRRLAQLQWQLAAPTYREGLQLIAAEDITPFGSEDLQRLF